MPNGEPYPEKAERAKYAASLADILDSIPESETVTGIDFRGNVRVRHCIGGAGASMVVQGWEEWQVQTIRAEAGDTIRSVWRGFLSGPHTYTARRVEWRLEQ